MVAFQLDALREVHQYAIIGEHREGGVFHVGLLAAPRAVEHGNKVVVFQMGPPVHLGPLLDGEAARMTAHVVGWPELTPPEVEMISDWLEGMQGENVEVSYIVHPPYGEERDKVNGKLVRRRFSCAGFVVSCYWDGPHIRLIDEPKLPPVDVDLVRRIWGHVLDRGDEGERAARRRKCGLEDKPPWPILLPGYLFHAVDRPREEIRSRPYEPQIEDHRFPRAAG